MSRHAMQRLSFFLLMGVTLYASLGSDFHFPGSHAAPGSMSVVPRTAAPPIWEHPRLAHMRDAAPGMLAAG